MVKGVSTWKQTWEVAPALMVAGGSFAVLQFVFATFHVLVPGVELYPMTDIGGGIFSLVVTAIFLQFWKPRHEWHFAPLTADSEKSMGKTDLPKDGHGAEAAALLANEAPQEKNPRPLTFGSVCLAWSPF